MPANVQGVLMPQTFGMAANYEDANCEKDYIGCIRASFKGTRTIALCYLHDMAAFMHGKGAAAPSSSADTKNFKNYMKKMDKAMMQEFATSHLLWYGTIGPSEALFQPCGMLVFERLQDKDVLGFRAPWILKNGIEHVESMVLALEKVKIPNQTLKDIVGLWRP